MRAPRGRRTPRRQAGTGMRTAGPRGGRVCDAPAAASPFERKLASMRVESAFDLRKPQRSRANGHFCPSALRLMVCPPARPPYETSTNRRAAGLGPRRACSRRSGRARPSPAAIGAGFVRLAAGCGWLRPAGVRGFVSRKRVWWHPWPRLARGAGRRRGQLHIFSVCCTFVGEGTVSCTFFFGLLQRRARPRRPASGLLEQNRRSDER